MFGKENKSIVELAKDFEEGKQGVPVAETLPSPADSTVPHSTEIRD